MTIRATMTLVALAILAPGAAMARIGAIDATPAATLLLPYFEVDLESASALTTLVSVNNADKLPVLVQATLWTDRAVPTRQFNVALAGYDVAVMNLRDLFVSGLVPGGPPLSEAQVAALVAAHRGLPDPDTGFCAGINHGDNTARGYMTFDVVNSTGGGAPTQAGYFVTGGAGVAGNRNVLWGDFSYVDPTNNFAQGERLVAIEASSFDSSVTTPGKYTFYATAVGENAADNREPLASVWGADFDVRAEESATTDIIYWRDPRSNANPAVCGFVPFPLPLTAYEIVAISEDSTPHEVANLDALPYACGRVSVSSLGIPFSKGWLRMDLNFGPGAPSQAFVMVITTREGRYSTGTQAMPLAPAAFGGGG